MNLILMGPIYTKGAHTGELFTCHWVFKERVLVREPLGPGGSVTGQPGRGRGMGQAGTPVSAAG